MTLSDDQLREQLKRRGTSAPLEQPERAGLVESIHVATSTPRQTSRRWVPWLGVPAAAGLTVVALLVAISLSLAPQAAPTSTPGITATPPPSSATPAPPSSPPAAAGLEVLSAEQLVALAADPSTGGQVVVSDAEVSFVPSPTQFDVPGSPQAFGTIESGGGSVVVIGQSFPDTKWKDHAFRLHGGGRVEYLGAVNDSTGDGTWTVPEAIAAAPPEAASLLFAVRGWLMQTVPAPCAAPMNIAAGQDYWCGGSWVTAEPVSNSDGSSVQLVIPDALHVRWDAYRQFALDPKLDLGGEPRLGIYLVRPNGCPPKVMGGCPVWEMVGRVDHATDSTESPAVQPQPTSTDQPSKPTPPATSLSFASDPPRWGSFDTGPGRIYGYEVHKCGDYETAWTGAWLELEDGTLVGPRSRYTGPFNGDPNVPAWLGDETQWMRPPEDAEGCFDGWVIFATSSPTEPRQLTAESGASLTVRPSQLPQPITQAGPATTAPPSPAFINVTRPYGGSDYHAWIQMSWRSDMTLADIRPVVENAAGQLLTLTGEPYWDAVVTFAPNVISHMYVGGQLPYSTGYDSWHFLFSGDGSDLKLAPEPWTYPPPLESVPTELVEQANQIAVSDDNAVVAMREYSDHFAFAEWDPNRTNVISLDYERRGTYGPEYVSIDVNLATGRVVKIREWVGPQ